MAIAYVQDPQKKKDLQEVYEFFVNYGYGDDMSNTTVTDPPTPDVTGSTDVVLKVDTAGMDIFGEKRQQFIDILGKISKMEVDNVGEDHLILTLTIKDVWKKVRV